MSEQYHPVVEENMVTDRTDINFGRAKFDLAQDAAIAFEKSNPKPGERSAGIDNWRSNVEHEVPRFVTLKIGEAAAKSAGLSDEAAAQTASENYRFMSKKASYGDTEAEASARSAMRSEHKDLDYDAMRNVESAHAENTRRLADEAKRLAA